jgi:hypothetical protein
MAAQSKLLRVSIGALLAALSLGNTAWAASNEAFATGIGGTKPILWRDYKPLQDNAIACMQDDRLETRTCQEVRAQVSSAMTDAFLQANLVNVGKPNSEKFCDEHARKLVLERDTSAMAAYAMLLVDERLKYGSGLYPSLQDTYLGKIVFDALVAQSQCQS